MGAARRRSRAAHRGPMQSSLRSAMRSSLWGMVGAFSVRISFHSPTARGKNRHDCTLSAPATAPIRRNDPAFSSSYRCRLHFPMRSQVAPSTPTITIIANAIARAVWGGSAESSRGRTYGCSRLTPSPYMCGDCRERIDAILNASISRNNAKRESPRSILHIDMNALFQLIARPTDLVKKLSWSEQLRIEGQAAAS